MCGCKGQLFVGVDVEGSCVCVKKAVVCVCVQGQLSVCKGVGISCVCVCKGQLCV